MVYDGALMRSILALGLAALILAAYVPGLFLETPVCSAVDGLPSRLARASCCGTADCPMHAHGSGKPGACTMDAAPGQRADEHMPRSRPASHGTKLCASSCGPEGARVMPGVPDPGTIDKDGQRLPCLSESESPGGAPRRAPTHSTDPAVPPPRS